jgi:hypothetical protein
MALLVDFWVAKKPPPLIAETGRSAALILQGRLEPKKSVVFGPFGQPELLATSSFRNGAIAMANEPLLKEI